MKYYIGFPISLNCNLRCSYCFNQEFFHFIDTGAGTNKWHDQRPFSLQDYRKWREKFLIDGTDFIMHLFGGEPFCQQNAEDVFEIIEFMDKERIDLLTNGIGDLTLIERLKKYSPFKFHRIGFTYHRKMMENKPELQKRFEKNVFTVESLGIPVYVKELLIKEFRDELVKNRKYWMSKGICFKVQDFKGEDKGISQEEYSKYTPVDRLLIDQEYKHESPCSCLKGYKNIFIRGFDMKDVWPKGGDVIACWHDPTVIGNVIEGWYNPDSGIIRNPNGTMDVKVTKKLYRGTYEKDLPQKT